MTDQLDPESSGGRPESDLDAGNGSASGRTPTVPEGPSGGGKGSDEPTLQFDSAEPAAGPQSEPPPPELSLPVALGRYLLTSKIGRGGFATVYEAFDEQLQRRVAIKVPHPWRFQSERGVEDFLREARQVAQLDHPNILTVYDVGQDKGLCYIVYKLIDGTSLSSSMRDHALSLITGVTLIAEVAEALDYAHRNGVYHRDVKPANILIDRQGRPYVADFGLAVKEEELPAEKSRRAGTAYYMSPEQVRGEGHRIDGRTDIYSLGVVLYELLCGRKPFEGGSREDIYDQILHRDARPPRQIVESIPRDLERICLTALAKRISERYTTARDLADELRAAATVLGSFSPETPATVVIPAQPGVQPGAEETSSSIISPVVPKGLSQFGPEDSSFFLELLPGPRNRHGLPESIQFWKSRIESSDPDQAFPVGLLYGPSGCGKSSLVRAGLLPRLDNSVTCAYVECTRDDTEDRLERALRRVCPELPGRLPVSELLFRLRRRQGMDKGRKILIILDQFEQWLHGLKGQQDTALTQALRQCDGPHLQCLLLVRDDFWLGTSRFMRQLEIRLEDGQNVALVDLFDVDHAQKVLASFGRAFGRLPVSVLDYSPEQLRFLKLATSALAENDQVIPIRLSLFAEILKSRPWMPSTLHTAGGVEGLGIKFLEETFCDRSANPRHRSHQRAAREVLRALLPEGQSQIVGHLQPYGVLLAASGYASRPADFDDLLSILEKELKLVSPSDPSGTGGPEGQAELPARSYQLTHDYLVPAVRDWLTRKQKETRRGRAQLRLAELSSLWKRTRSAKTLPSTLEWTNLMLLTRRRDWTALEREMMRAAGLRQLAGGVAIAALLVAAIITQSAWRADRLVDQLLSAEVSHVRPILNELAPHRHWATRRLRLLLEHPDTTDRQKLYLRLALVDQDPNHRQALLDSMFQASPDEFLMLRESLRSQANVITEGLWRMALDETGDPGKFFRAACALALYDPENDRWSRIAPSTATTLAQQNTIELAAWTEALEPVQNRLLEHLEAVFVKSDRAGDRQGSAAVLAKYYDQRPVELIRLLELADPTQIHILTLELRRHKAVVIPNLIGKLARQSPGTDTEEITDSELQALANYSSALLLLDEQAGWALLRRPNRTELDDPTARTMLIHQLAACRVSPQSVMERFRKETDSVARRGLLLAMGEFPDWPKWPNAPDLIDELLETYQKDRNAGVHCAALWLLRSWDRDGSILQKIREINGTLRSRVVPEDREWFINELEHTMVIVRGPVQYQTDSSVEEAPKVKNPRHVKLPRAFAISATETTVGQFTEILGQGHQRDEKLSPATDCPMNSVALQDALRYCQKLTEREQLDAGEYYVPTQDEWEYCCRGGSREPWCFGRVPKFLDLYGRYAGNSSINHLTPTYWPVASLRPNEFGLFDMHGNIMEWTMNRDLTDKELERVLGPDPIASTLGLPPRALCGNWLHSSPKGVTSTSVSFQPSFRSQMFGFRIARRIPD